MHDIQSSTLEHGFERFLNDTSATWHVVRLAALVCLCLLVYSNAFHRGFCYDDYHHIVENESLRDLRNVQHFFGEPSTASTFGARSAMYRPLLLSTFALNFTLFGEGALSFHITNVFIHCITVAAVYLLAHMLAKRALVAFLAAAVFAIHPVNAEAVNYVSARSSALCSVWYILGFACFLKAHGARSRRAVCLWVAASASAYALSVCTKELALSFPLVVAFAELLLCRENKEGFVKTVGKYHLAIWLVTAAFIGLRFTLFAQYGPFAVGGGGYFVRGVWENVLTQSKAIVFYIFLFLFPFGLNVDHHIAVAYSLVEPAVLASLAVILGVVGAAVYYRRKRPLVAFAIAWYLITLVPTSSVHPLNVILNEHRLYLPSIGFCLFVGIVLAGIAPKLAVYWPGERRSPTFNHVAVALLLTILLGVLTHQRNYVWRNELVLWEDAARKSPRKYRTHAELGDAYLRGGEYRKGATAYQRALELNPYHLLTDAPEKVKALWTEEEIARINPKNTLAESYHGGLHNNLGVAYSHLGRFAEALSEYEAAVSFAPLFVQARINLAKAYVRQGRPDDARSQLDEALRLDPSNNTARELLEELSPDGSHSP